MSDKSLSRPALKFASGELVFGYRLIRELGRGSFGQVWLATNDKGFEWALKIVSLVGSGGKKEFRALQLIKDRKIKSTHLLKLIDYGLLDKDGTSLVTAPASPPAPGPKIVSMPPARGTLIPGKTINPAARTSIEQVAARDTHQDKEQGDEDLGDLHNRATWLIIVMEVGDRTLHELQLAETKQELSQRAVRMTRAVKRSGQTIQGAQKRSALTEVPPDPAEEPLVPLPVARILPYIDQAARGLDYLHRNDILHRDVKPQNIMLVDADAKLCDYGLASEVRNASATTEGCSPAYAAPEAINNRPVPASDQYALAVTYVELISGRWPFFGTTQTAIYREKDEGRHNLTFIRNRRTRLVLARALAKNPEDRFPTCTEFAQQLALAEQSSSRSVVKPLLVAAAGGLAISLATVGYVKRHEIAELLKGQGGEEKQTEVKSGNDNGERTSNQETSIRPVPDEQEKNDSDDHALDPQAGPDPLQTLAMAEFAPMNEAASVVALRSVMPRPKTKLEPASAFVPKLPGSLPLTSTRRRHVAAMTDSTVIRPVRIPRSKPARPMLLASLSLEKIPPLPPRVYNSVDDELLELWQDSTKTPQDYLKRHIEVVARTERPDEWWNRLAARAGEQQKWMDAAESYLAKDMSSAPQSLITQAGFVSFRAKVQDVALERLLSREPRTMDEARRALSTQGYLLNKDRPFAKALKLEWELRLAAPRPAEEETKWLQAGIADLEATQPETAGALAGSWSMYPAYVRALLHARRSEADDPKTTLTLLNQLLQADQLPGWLTGSRKEVVRQTAGRTALAALSCTNSDVLKFSALKLATLPEAQQLGERARIHQLNSMPLSVASALAAATSGEPTAWPQIQLVATSALEDAETRQLLQRQDRLVLLEYVAALAQLKSGASDLDPAIDRLALVLQARQGTGPRYFNFGDGASPQDQGVLKNLLQPALEHPSIAGLKPASATTSASLAALWGAQGRLLQRNPTLVASLPGFQPGVQDEFAEALRRAHESFNRARSLDAQSPRRDEYLVGFATTLVARPSLGGPQLARDGQLIKLMDGLSSASKAALGSNPGMQALQGHVQRMEGNLAAASAAYESALSSTSSAADPYFIREACLIGLCYVRVEQAAQTPWTEAEFAHAALEAELPPEGTKSYFLRSALEQAEAAEQQKTSLQREQIYLAKGYALEQLASQLDCRTKYGEAHAAYKQALAEAEKAKRPTAACRLAKGRYYVLGVTDLATNLDAERKIELLRLAIEDLTAALDERVDLSYAESKQACDLSASYWRAVARLELGKLLPEDQKKLDGEAGRDLAKVLELGKSVVSTEVGDAFRLLLWRARPRSGAHTTASQAAVKRLLEQALDMLKEEPANFSPQTLLDVVEENRATPPVGQVSPLSWFPMTGRLDEQWDASVDWKVAGTKVATLASSNNNASDEFRKRANKLANSIREEGPRSQLAKAYCNLKQLPLALQVHFARQNNAGGGAAAGAGNGGGAPALGKDQSLGLVMVEFEKTFASVQQSVDSVTQKHLADLNKLPIEKLKERYEALDPLPRRLIREHLLREITLEDRLKFNELAKRANEDASHAGLNKLAHDMLKPAFLLPIVDPENRQQAERLSAVKARLNDLEIKLKIRAEPKPAPAANNVPKKNGG